MFNEGYHGACAEAAIRAELCREAMRLAAELLAHPHGRKPASYALAALMAFGAARLAARADDSGALLSLIDQDRSLWDQTLIDEGLRLLEQSASGAELTTYHLEAAIAAAHARAPSIEATDWAAIVSIYDALIAIRPSPIVALNRAIAIAERDGAEQGRAALEAIEDRDRLARYPFYPAALGEMALRRGECEDAAAHFRAALKLARNPMERGFMERRIAACD